jgi:EmrB/QacA subfamily drug resistance transporter
MPSPLADRRLQVLILVCLGQFMLLVDDTIVNVALPSIQEDLGFTESGLTWVANAYFLALGGFLLVGGKAADLLGRRRVLMAALGAFAAASAVCGLAPSAEVLVGARGVQGLAGAFISPAALAILLATFPEGRERTQALGVWAGLTGIGAATGLLAGGALVEALDWRWVFLINVPVALVVVPMVRGRVPADAPRDGRRSAPDILGAVLGTSALLVFTLTVIRTDHHAWTSAWTLGGLAVAVVLGLAAALRERRSPEPLIPRELLRSRTNVAANALMLVGAAGLFAMFFFLTLYMQLVLGWGALKTGVSYLPFSFVMAATSGVVAKALDGRSARGLLLIGPAIGGLGLWMMSGLEATSEYAAHLLPALAVTAFGLGLTFVPLINAATGGAGEGDGGGASALLTTCQQIGAVLGIAVMVTIATTQANDALAAGVPQGPALVEGFQAAFRVQAVVLAAAGLLSLLMRPSPRGAAEPAQGRVDPYVTYE